MTMKKTAITMLSSMVSVSLFAATVDFTQPINFGTQIGSYDSDITVENTITITDTDAGDSGFRGVSGGTINAAAATVIDSSSDFNFACDFNVIGNTYATIKVNKGTLTFEKLSGYAGATVEKSRLYFIGAGATLQGQSKVVIEQMNFQGELLAQKGVELHLNESEGIAMNRLQLYTNSKVVVESGNTFSEIYVRERDSDTRYSGTIDISKISGEIKTATIYFNDTSASKRGGALCFDFGENSGAQILSVRNLIETNALEGNQLLLKNFNFDEDQFIIEYNKDLSSLIRFVDLGEYGKDYLVSIDKTYSGTGNRYIAQTVVPEPATYAAVFGALALAFALRRRCRK